MTAGTIMSEAWETESPAKLGPRGGMKGDARWPLEPHVLCASPSLG